MAATSPPPGGGSGGSFLTRKLGPLPMWAWVGIGVAALYLYQQRKAAANAAASSQQQSAATSALANQGAAAMQYGYSAPDLASMISNLQGQVSLLGGGNNGTTTTTSSSPGSTGNPAETLVGSGYYVPGSEQPIFGQGGHTYEWIANPSVLASLPRGTPVFFQPAPGIFSTTAGAKLTAGTPQFVQVS